MFYKSVKKDNFKSMFEFLNGHYEYYTMNSWNGTKSIANNVKLYNLPLRNNSSDALAALERDEWMQVNMTIEDFNNDHDVNVFFNGRSSGYLVLAKKSSNSHVFKSSFYSPTNYCTYEDWAADVKETYGALKNYKSELLYEVNLVQAFDKLCDDLVLLVDLITDEYLKDKAEEEYRQSHMKSFSATKHFEEYNYDTLEDYELHMKFMKEKGYSVYETNSDDLYTMFELNESIHDEVFVDDRKESK